MITKQLIFIAIPLVLLVTQACSEQQLKKPGYGKVVFFKDNFAINVEIAKTDTEKSIGLMFRENLAKNKGMLFVYKQENILKVWMKNTLISLDIIFISAQGVIVSIVKSAQPCFKIPCQIYDSKEAAQYMLEINAGLVEKKGIRVGDKLQFNSIQFNLR